MAGVGVLTLYPGKKEVKLQHSRSITDDLTAKVTYASGIEKLAGTEGVSVEATYKISKSDKLTATHELAGGLKTVKYTANLDFATVEPSYAVQKKALSVTVTKKIDQDTFKVCIRLLLALRGSSGLTFFPFAGFIRHFKQSSWPGVEPQAIQGGTKDEGQHFANTIRFNCINGLLLLFLNLNDKHLLWPLK